MAGEQRSGVLNVRSAFECRFRQVAQLGGNVYQQTKRGRESPVRRIQPDIVKKQALRRKGFELD